MHAREGAQARRETAAGEVPLCQRGRRSSSPRGERGSKGADVMADRAEWRDQGMRARGVERRSAAASVWDEACAGGAQGVCAVRERATAEAAWMHAQAKRS